MRRDSLSIITKLYFGILKYYSITSLSILTQASFNHCTLINNPLLSSLSWVLDFSKVLIYCFASTKTSALLTFFSASPKSPFPTPLTSTPTISKRSEPRRVENCPLSRVRYRFSTRLCEVLEPLSKARSSSSIYEISVLAYCCEVGVPSLSLTYC